MFTLAQPRAMRSLNCSGARPVPPCSTMGIGRRSTISVTRSGVSLGLDGIEPVRGPDGRCERVHPGVLDELERHLDRVHLAGLVGAHVVLDALHALDLSLHVRAVAARLLHHLGRLAGVLLDVEVRAVEQDRVPARLEAGGRPFALGAVVEVQGDGTGASSAIARNIS